MASKALLLGLVTLGAALVPPCLPELGPEFCPGVIQNALDDYYDEYRELVPAVFPDLMQGSVLRNEVFPRLNTTRMEEELRLLTLPSLLPNRFCKAKQGIKAKEYIDNDSPQRSIILRIVPHETPFEAGDTIVVGAHMDSINGKNLNMTPDGMIAPGADDNGSGTIVLLAVLSALGRLFAEKPVLNEVQFHWYGAEEVGLWGSKSVFETLKNESFRVKAMLNLDMVGYSGGHAPGFPKIALQEGYVDKSLTAFTAKLIEKYSQAQVGMASCGYPCSDHASAHMYGFPSAMIGESSYLAGNGNIPNGNPNIHSDTDTIETIDRDYMLEFAKVTAAFIVELAYTNFTTLETEANQAGGW